ncbi:MAG: DMT family transporter [Rhodobacteraceae bacterium]|nr:DMT family transporter [Paracoccaceae bacterium]
MAVQALRARTENRSYGIFLMLITYILFTGIDVCARWLTREAGLPTMETVFIRYLGHLIIVSALFLPIYRESLFRTRNFSDQIWRGVFLLGSTICNFTAVQYLPLSLTAAIFFAVPILVCLLSIPLLGERVGVRRWTAILVGFVGVLWITWPFGAEAHWAMFFSLGATVLAGLYGIWTRKLAGVDPTNTQQFYAALVATIGIAPLAVMEWVWPSRPVDWVVFAAIGLFGWAGHQIMTIAHRYAPASTLAPFIYVQIVYLSLADFLVFHILPDPAILPGAAIVLAAGLYIWLRERTLSEQDG